MVHKQYAIHDSGSESYLRPFLCRADGEALRLFKELVKDKEHPVGAHPEFYKLFRIGSFNDSTGEVVGHPPTVVARAWELPSAAVLEPTTVFEPFEELDAREAGNGSVSS